MKRNYSAKEMLILVAMVAILSPIIGGVTYQVLAPQSAIAQGLSSGNGQITLYAGPRRDTFKDESFIFYNQDTGDIWVYRNKDFKKHYRVASLGQNLEEIKK